MINFAMLFKTMKPVNIMSIWNAKIQWLSEMYIKYGLFKSKTFGQFCLDTEWIQNVSLEMDAPSSPFY